MYKQLIFLFLLTSTLYAQSQADTTALREVNIKTSAAVEKAYQSTANVSFLERKDLLQSNQSIITPLLNKVPGVYMMQGGLNTTKINIRGIGARAQYETNRIKLYFNNIPLTTANGTSILHDIDLTTLTDVKVIKGPQASQFGAGLGGVVQLRSKLKEEDRASSELLSGSYDLLKQNYSLSTSEDDKSLQLTYNNLSANGFRENSNYQRESYFLHSEWELSPESKLQFLGQIARLKAFIASSVSRTDLQEDPTQAAFTWNQARGFESYTRGTFGVNYSQQISKQIEQNTAVFTHFRDAYEPRPFDILEENNLGIGLRHTSTFDFDLFGFTSQLKVGGEFLRDDYEVGTFENLYEENEGRGSVQGRRLSDMSQIRQYIEGFTTLDVNLSNEWKVRLGLATNKTSYQIDDTFSSPDNSQTGDFSYDQIWLPNIVSTYSFSDNQKIIGSISKGFSVPTVEQSLTEEGQFNTDLKPEKGWNYELGYKAKWFDNKLLTELTAYYMNVENLLVARRVAEDQFVGVNAGSTDHPGIEIAVRSNLNVDNWLNIQPFANASFNFYTFDEFVDQENNYSGNELTGVPSRQLSAGIEAQAFKRIHFYFQTNAISEIPVNDENTVYANPYAFSNAKLAYELPLLNLLTARFNVGINNLFNEQYAASVVTNAIGFGGSEPRYFYPGEPRNYFGSVALQVRF